MATTWEKVEDDFNNRFMKYLKSYKTDQLSNSYTKNMTGIDKFEFLPDRYKEQYISFINDLNNNYEYIDSKFTNLKYTADYSSERYWYCIFLILYNKNNKNIINITMGIQHYINYGHSDTYYIYPNSIEEFILYQYPKSNIIFNDFFNKIISSLKNLDIILFKFDRSPLQTRQQYNTLSDYSLDYTGCNLLQYINDPYIAAFEAIESLQNDSDSDKVDQLIEKSYNEGFEKGYESGVMNTKKAFIETKKQYDSLFNY